MAILDLDAMLTQNLDTVEDLPDYVMPPTGIYKLSIADASVTILEAKEGKEKSARMVIEYKVEATVEVKDELPVADGSLFSERFTYSEQGLQYFKRQAKQILGVESLEGISLGEILDALKTNPVFDAVVTKSHSAANPNAVPPVPEYTNVRVRAIPTAV